MNAIQSYLRHLIVTGIVLLVAKYQLPLEGSEDVANAIALAAIGTLTWLVAKYAPPGLLKVLGFSAMLCLGVSLPSCAPGTPVTFRLLAPGGSVGYSSKAGLSIDANLNHRTK